MHTLIEAIFVPNTHAARDVYRLEGLSLRKGVEARTVLAVDYALLTLLVCVTLP